MQKRPSPLKTSPTGPQITTTIHNKRKYPQKEEIDQTLKRKAQRFTKSRNIGLSDEYVAVGNSAGLGGSKQRVQERHGDPMALS